VSLASWPMTDTYCHSCGRTGEAVDQVRRVYVTPEQWDQEGKVEVVDEVETWCLVCRSHYPHQPVET
jgi:hypothetical protein